MKKVIAEGAQSRYAAENVKLLLWLYDNENFRGNSLEEWFQDKINDAARIDAANGWEQNQKTQRKKCKEVLQEIGFGEKNCPIILPALTFNIFSQYLTTRKKKDGTMLSATSYGTIRSALSHLYRLKGSSKMSTQFNQDMNQFMAGLKRSSVDERTKTGKRLNEGKTPMSFEVYELMCQFLQRHSSCLETTLLGYCL